MQDSADSLPDPRRDPEPGDRVVFLLAPLPMGQPEPLRAVTLSPLTLADEMGILKAEDRTPFGVIERMTGISELALGGLRGHDVDAVLETVTAMLPERLRSIMEA